MNRDPMVPEESSPVSKPFWRRLPPATTLLVLMCVAWTVQIPLSGESFQSAAAMDRAGAIRPSSLWDNEFERLVTAIFLHGGWLHLLINAVSLWFVGKVIEQGVGRPAYLLFVIGAAIGGVATSLLWNTSPMWRVGISGGIAGLIGLVLALEWGVSQSWIGFLKARNTIMVLVVLAINVGISIYFGTVQGAQIDNAGHLGGFSCGLLGGLAYFPRSALRPVRGALVLFLLVVPSLAYASRPVWNADYYSYRIQQAQRGGNVEGEIAALRRYLGLRPGEVGPSIRLALLTDAPDPIGKLSPKRAAEANAVATAWLELASRRLDGQPGVAQQFSESAAALPHAAVSGAWLAFGRRAFTAEQVDLASYAFRQAYDASQVLGRGAAHWEPAWAMLEMAMRDAGEAEPDAVALARLLVLAREAAPGLAHLKDPTRSALEQEILRVAAVAVARAQAAKGEEQRSIALPLSELFAKLAGHTPESDPRIATFDLQMAIWWWVAAPDKDEPETLAMGAGRFTTAWRSARTAKNEAVEAFAANWLQSRGLPLPAPELAADEDGG